MGEAVVGTRIRPPSSRVGWSDALIDRIGRLPVPAWLVYGIAAALLLAWVWPLSVLFVVTRLLERFF